MDPVLSVLYNLSDVEKSFGTKLDRTRVAQFKSPQGFEYRLQCVGGDYQSVCITYKPAKSISDPKKIYEDLVSLFGKEPVSTTFSPNNNSKKRYAIALFYIVPVIEKFLGTAFDKTKRYDFKTPQGLEYQISYTEPVNNVEYASVVHITEDNIREDDIKIIADKFRKEITNNVIKKEPCNNGIYQIVAP